MAACPNFPRRLIGSRVEAARRRGKYLWLELSEKEAILAHLGMSGQMLLQPEGAPYEKHLRVRLRFDDGGPELRFVDQRTFGGLALDDLAEGPDFLLPSTIAHIGRDPMDPAFDLDAAVRALRSRRTEVKRALLDQTLVSGIGNIYADEALWRAKLHWARPTETMTRGQIAALFAGVHEVFAEALRAGGTSFDSLYVNVDGESGYFDRTLNVYGRAGEPCARCGTPVRKIAFINRSSYFCPTCQRVPRRSPGRARTGSGRRDQRIRAFRP